MEENTETNLGAIVAPRLSRFSGAPWFPTSQVDILVGGAGGIGSWLSLFIARGGFYPFVYDFDLYEEHNMAGQFCRKSDITMPKVDALKSSISEFCNVEIETMNERYTIESMSSQFSMSGFDNMEARKVMFYNWVEEYGKDTKAIFIDGRLSVEQLQIFCIIGGDAESIEKYRTEHLFDDSEVQEPICTFKQTSHSAAMIASHMFGFFTNHYTNVLLDTKVSSVPFYWEYLIPVDMLTSEYNAS